MQLKASVTSRGIWTRVGRSLSGSRPSTTVGEAASRFARTAFEKDDGQGEDDAAVDRGDPNRALSPSKGQANCARVDSRYNPGRLSGRRVCAATRRGDPGRLQRLCLCHRSGCVCPDGRGLGSAHDDAGLAGRSSPDGAGRLLVLAGMEVRNPQALKLGHRPNRTRMKRLPSQGNRCLDLLTNPTQCVGAEVE